MTIYLLICVFTFLSFIASVIRCIKIVEEYGMELKSSNTPEILTYLKTFLIITVPIVHIVFLIGFIGMLFYLNDEELKEALENASK